MYIASASAVFIYVFIIGKRNAPDERVDLGGLHVPQLLDGVLDLTLVRTNVDDEDESVVLLNLLHRALRVQRPGVGS